MNLGVPSKQVQGKPWRAYVCCPYCPSKGKSPDTKFHLGINFKTGNFKCFRCNTAGTLHDLQQHIKGALSFGVHDYGSTSLEDLKNRLNSTLKLKEDPTYDLDQFSWPISEDDTPVAYKYVKERGFSDEEMRVYDLRVGRAYFEGENQIKKWSGRVLFPYYEDGDVTFVVGRAYTGKDPKYLNSPTGKDRVVYGIERVQNRTAILCEGFISAKAAERHSGVSGLSTLGKTLSPRQLTRIQQTCDTVFVCLDGTDDVLRSERSRINRQLIRAKIKVYEVLMRHGDPDDEPAEFIRAFKEARRIML